MRISRRGFLRLGTLAALGAATKYFVSKGSASRPQGEFRNSLEIGRLEESTDKLINRLTYGEFLPEGAHFYVETDYAREEINLIVATDLGELNKLARAQQEYLFETDLELSIRDNGFNPPFNPVFRTEPQGYSGQVPNGTVIMLMTFNPFESTGTVFHTLIKSDLDLASPTWNTMTDFDLAADHYHLQGYWYRYNYGGNGGYFTIEPLDQEKIPDDVPRVISSLIGL